MAGGSTGGHNRHIRENMRVGQRETNIRGDTKLNVITHRQ
jgi:hypothetical protein